MKNGGRGGALFQRGSADGGVRVVMVDCPGSRFGTVETWGMAALGLPELEAREIRRFLLPRAAEVLCEICAYLIDRGERAPPTTPIRLRCASWIRLTDGSSESGRDVRTLIVTDAPESARDPTCDEN